MSKPKMGFQPESDQLDKPPTGSGVANVSTESLKLLHRATPFNRIEWRVGVSGKKKDGSIWALGLAYMDNRYVQDTLDEIVGVGNWQNQFKPWRGDTASLCGISIWIRGEWVTKWDGAPDTGFEAIKGGLSDSQKRAAVQWGIGRDLYDVESQFLEISQAPKDGFRKAQYTDKSSGQITTYWWRPPTQEELKTTGAAEQEDGADNKPEVKAKAKVKAATEQAVARNPVDPTQMGTGLTNVGLFDKDSIVPDNVTKPIKEQALSTANKLALLRNSDLEDILMEYLPFPKGADSTHATAEMVNRFKKGKAINWLVKAAEKMAFDLETESSEGYKKLADDDDLPF